MGKQVKALVALSAVMALSAAQAVPVTFFLSGSVTSLSDPQNLLNNSLAVADKVYGAYTFDSQTPDRDSRSTVGAYSLTSAMVQIGNQLVQLSMPLGEVSVFNDIPDFNFADRYHVVWTDLASTSRQAFDFTFFDPSGTALSSDALPVAPPSLSEFPAQHSGTWRYFDSNGQAVLASANIEIDSISLFPKSVPEPASLGLVSAALAGLVAVRRRSGRGRRVVTTGFCMPGLL